MRFYVVYLYEFPDRCVFLPSQTRTHAHTHVQALAGWFVVWAALVSIPPGHSEQRNVIRMNMVRKEEERQNNPAEQRGDENLC